MDQGAQQQAGCDIVLVGGGHSHVEVLRRFGMRPEPGVRLTLISPDTHTPYSGMLPGYVAGHYGFDDVHIDLERLAAFAGARFVRGEVTGLNRESRRLMVKGHALLSYDWLSINIGSMPQRDQVPGASEHAVPVKPLAEFNQRWLALLARVRAHPGGMAIAVVGGGAGGVELTLAMQYRLRHALHLLGRDPDALTFHLFSADACILPTHNASVRKRFSEVLQARNVRVHLGSPVQEVAEGHLRSETAGWVEADEVVWVTQAGGAQWLRQAGLALDARGFVRTNSCLQSITDPRVFAAGDVASIDGQPLEKAGVFAVRMGPPLAGNLRLSVLGQPLRPYHPQRRWLALISTGDRYAVASRGAYGFSGRWVWRWKDWIDRRFMRRYSALSK